MRAAEHDGLSLTEILQRLGYRHEPVLNALGEPFRDVRRIVRVSDGAWIMNASYEDAIDWLCESKKIEPSKTTVQRWRRNRKWNERAARLLKEAA